MELSELLLELRENILHDRSDRTGGNSDLMWSDETLVRYINEAQRRFARQGLVIRDGTTAAATQITTEDGVNFYPLHKSVLAVISARLAGDEVDLARAGHANMDARQPTSEMYFPPSQTSNQPGKPVIFTTDEYLSEAAGTDEMSATTLRLYPVPSSDYAGKTVNLRVVRMPLNDLELGANESLEIPEDHHLEMLDWAAYLALRILDADMGDPVRAREFRKSFEIHVAEARQVSMRKLFAPMPWGFGRGGWAWES